MPIYHTGGLATRRRARAQAEAEARRSAVMAEVGDQDEGHFLRFEKPSLRAVCCARVGGRYCTVPAITVRVERCWPLSGEGPVPGEHFIPLCEGHLLGDGR